MKNLILISAICISINSFSQGKVKLAATPINKSLPQDLTNRIFWTQTDLFKFNINQLAGSIIYSEEGSDGFTRGPRIVDLSSNVQIKTIEKGLLYHAKIDNGFKADLKVIIFSAGITKDQIVDIKITDLLSVFIDYEKIPIDSILKATKALNQQGKKYYIQGAVLTSIEQQYNSKVTGNASLVGNAFGANNSVYNESLEYTQDYRISLTLIDLDKLKFFKSSSNLSTSEENKNLINASIEKNISKMIEIKGF